MADPHPLQEQVPTQLPDDYDEYGSEPTQAPTDDEAPRPDEALSDPT